MPRRWDVLCEGGTFERALPRNDTGLTKRVVCIIVTLSEPRGPERITLSGHEVHPSARAVARMRSAVRSRAYSSSMRAYSSATKRVLMFG